MPDDDAVKGLVWKRPGKNIQVMDDIRHALGIEIHPDAMGDFDLAAADV
jgi:hypothetical protein